jgi:hypothetical protein
LIDGVREKRTFNNMQDVWKVVDLVIEETKQVNIEQGKSFDITESLIAQIPFFACNNRFFDRQVNQDIEKYLYCEKFNVPPYTGSYEEQPALWVRRAFAIKSAIAKKEKKDINGRKNTNSV